MVRGSQGEERLSACNSSRNGVAYKQRVNEGVLRARPLCLTDSNRSRFSKEVSMAVNPTQSTQSIQALEQYRQTQQPRQGAEPPQPTEPQDRVTLQGGEPERTAQQQAPESAPPEDATRRQAIAAYENANRTAQQTAAPEKQNERTLNALRA